MAQLVSRNHLSLARQHIPLAQVVDPTGAGDSFAGGFMGYLASVGDLSERFNPQSDDIRHCYRLI